MGGDETRRAVTLLLLGGLVLASVAVTPAGAISCDDYEATQIGGTEGSWVVSDGDEIRSYGSGASWYDGDYLGVENAWPGESADGTDSVTRAFARGPTGDWWVVGTDGRVARFTENWAFTGEWSWFEGGDGGTDDIAHLNGQWWVLRDDALVAYDENWSRVDGYRLRGEHTGLTAANDSLWTVSTDGSVTQLDTGNGKPRVVRVEERAIGRELRDPEDLVRAVDGDWWVLSKGPGIAEYSPAWEHTGYQHGDVKNTVDCGSTESSPVWVLGLLLLVAVPGLVGTVWTNREPSVVLARAGLSVGVFSVAFVLYSYSLPALFSWLYRLPDVAVSAPLVIAPVLLSVVPSLVRDDRSLADVIVLAMITLPLFFAGLIY